MSFGKHWSADTLVWVTDWGHAVHRDPSCPGISAFRSTGEASKVRVGDRISAVRRACKKCFGEFYGADSLRVLDRLIEKLHGKVDFDQKARTLIAITARIRFGDSDARPLTARRSSKKGESGSSARKTSNRRRPTGQRGSSTALASRSGQATVSKAEAKRRRDRAAAAKLGISVEELRRRRRDEHEARTAAKSRRSTH